MTNATAARRWRPAARDLITGGMLGTAIALSLSALMLVAQTENASGVPKPLGVAFAAHLFGAATLGERGLLPVGLALHVGYVAAATAVATIAFRRRGVLAAVATALTLWVVAGLAITPYVGWGLFGAAVGARAVLGVLAVHAGYALFLAVGFWLAFHHIPATQSSAAAYPGSDTRRSPGRVGLGDITAPSTD